MVFLSTIPTLWRVVIIASLLLLTACDKPERTQPQKPQGTELAPEEPVASHALHIRKDINTLSPEEIATLRNGIRVMMNRPASDPTSYSYQASIHGNSSNDQPQMAWNTCQHSSFFFLPWHRMYLYYFERILRAATDDPDFTLPYWNYTKFPTQAAARTLPLPFRVPKNTSNPLFIQERFPAINAGGALPASAVSLSPGFNFPNFSSSTGSGLSFGGQFVSAPKHFGSPHSAFETTPHDAIHTNIGGFMRFGPDAAKDPIFFSHHANIDRLWNAWVRGACANPDSSTWLNQEFTFFDENGTAVTMTAAEVLDTASQLGYRYDELPSVSHCMQPLSAEIFAVVPPEVISERQSFQLVAERTTAFLKLTNGKLTEEHNYVLNLEDIEIDAMPRGHYEIYINLPEGIMADYMSKHYIGNLPFFGLTPRGMDGHGHPATPATYNYLITKLLRNLSNVGDETQDIRVTFIPREPEPPMHVEVIEELTEAATVFIKRITITRSLSGG